MNSIRLVGEAVEKRYGRIAALRGVDFEIAAGECISILGANGAGKSSLLRILSGLSRPSGGRFDALSDDAPSTKADGTAQRLSREALRGAIGYVGHATLLYGELSARENLVFAARLHGRRPTVDQLDRILEDFSLLDVAERRAGTFSRGMAQRLSIARAIVHEPALLLLDEPFTGLDELSAERLSTRLAAQRQSGRSLAVVTHDPRRAVELSDRALILHRGLVRATPSRAAARESGTAFEVDALRATLSALSAEALDEAAI
ncbi:MAG: ABC transporter ATP-binding protein [bacterium]|nr:ABC transporter ATP-binding protein [bacterium]